MAFKYIVNTKDTGLTVLDIFPAKAWVRELCSYRTFDSLKQLQDVLRVIDVSQEAYDRGLGCPRDARVAIELVKSLPQFKLKKAVMTSNISAKDLYDKLNEAAKKGMILLFDKIEEPHGGSKCWMAEVVDGIEEVA